MCRPLTSDHVHLSASYNQLEEDFASLREYNDYLEEVETIGM